MRNSSPGMLTRIGAPDETTGEGPVLIGVRPRTDAVSLAPPTAALEFIYRHEDDSLESRRDGGVEDVADDRPAIERRAELGAAEAGPGAGREHDGPDSKCGRVRHGSDDTGEC